MKKTILLLLFSIASFAQTSNGTEYRAKSFRADSPQTVTSINYLVTMGTDGTMGRISNVSLPFLTKVSTVTGNAQAYVKSADGSQTMYDINEEFICFSNINLMTSYSGNAKTVIVSEANRGGTFVYKTGSFTNDNGVIFTATGKGSGYWERQYTGTYINVQWFPDIVSDGVTDCAAGINAISSVYTYRYFPAGRYKLNSAINISGNIAYWSFIGDDTPMKTENKGTVFLANFSGNVFDTGISYSYEGIQFKNFQIWHVTGGYGIRSGWPETRIENVRMLLEYGNGVNIAFVAGSNGAFDCTLLDVKIEGRFTDTPVTYSGTGLYVDSGSNNLLFANSFLYGFSNAIIIKSSENVNIIQNNLNANGGDYAIKVLSDAGTINLNIENNYIESQNRALYIGQAKGVHLTNNIINDAGFGGSDNLSDAHLYFDINTSSVSLIGNTITSSFQNQSFVYSANDVTFNDNHWTRNRSGSTFLGNNFAVPASSWQRDILNTITSGSVVTNIRRIVGTSGTFTGNLSAGGATSDAYPLLVRAATNANFRVSKLGTNPQIAFVDDIDSSFGAFSLGGNWQTFSSSGAVNFSSLAGTGDSPVITDASGNLKRGLDSDYVKITGNQTIGGIKIFSNATSFSNYIGFNTNITPSFTTTAIGRYNNRLVFMGSGVSGANFTLTSNGNTTGVFDYVMPDTSGKLALDNGIKTYTALIDQSSTGNPTTTILGNNTIGSIVWTRSTNGFYFGTLTGAFPAGKTYLNITPSSPTASYSIFRNTADQIVIRTQDNSTVPFTDADTKLFSNSIKIEVYP